MSFFGRFRRAVKASISSFGPQTYRAGGEVVVCPVCKGREFVRSTGNGYTKPPLLKVSVPWMSLSGLATTLICTHCTHILTFGRGPEVQEEDGF